MRLAIGLMVMAACAVPGEPGGAPGGGSSTGGGGAAGAGGGVSSAGGGTASTGGGAASSSGGGSASSGGGSASSGGGSASSGGGTSRSGGGNASNGGGTSSGPSTFAQRCASPDVVTCVGFDDFSEVDGGYGDNRGLFPGDSSMPELDTAQKASGISSLKFTIPGMSGANAGGSFFINFSRDLSVQFGASSELFVQWRQRFSADFLDTMYAGGEGWKLAIIGTGDQPSQLYASCTALEVVTQNTFQRGFAQMYNSCTGSTSHGAYDGFEEPFNGSDFKLQNARPAPYCLYSQGSTGYFPPNGNCFAFFPDEWMTFQVHIKTGPRVNDEFTDSHVDLWIAREGQPSEQALSWGPYNLTAGAPADDQKFGKVWLLPYHTDKDPTQAHPTGYVCYDELIVSRSRIADP